MLFPKGEKKDKIISLIFFSYSLAKRYLLTDSIVKLKEFQQKKVAIAYNLPSTKGSSSVCFVDSFIRLSFKLPLFLYSFETYHIEGKKVNICLVS